MDYLTFALDHQRCALPASEVVEVQRAVALAWLPRCPAIVEGVLDLRGRLVPVLDIRARLGLPPSPLGLTDQLVFARVPRTREGAAPPSTGDRVVALRVDRALDLLPLPSVDIEDPRPVAGAAHVAGVAKRADGLIIIYDLRTFLSLDEEGQLARALSGEAAP